MSFPEFLVPVIAFSVIGQLVDIISLSNPMHAAFGCGTPYRIYSNDTGKVSETWSCR